MQCDIPVELLNLPNDYFKLFRIIKKESWEMSNRLLQNFRNS